MALPSRPALVVCSVLLLTASLTAQQTSPTKPRQRPQPTSAVQSATQESQIVTTRAAGPQTADEEGRTLLPMKVAKNVSFRQIGPAISGGRVPAVAGVPGKPFTYYVGTADGGLFRSNDDGITWKALLQHETVASVGAI